MQETFTIKQNQKVINFESTLTTSGIIVDVEISQFHCIEEAKEFARQLKQERDVVKINFYEKKRDKTV